MPDLPTIVKVLKYLVGAPAPSTYNDISRAVPEGQALLDRAMAELVARGLVDRQGEVYCYRASSRADELCRKLFALYDKVVARPQKELLVRGILSLPGPRYLWRMSNLLDVLDKEGFASEDAIPFLDEEVGKDYIRRVKIIFVARVSFVPPAFIPYYRMSDFRSVEGDEYQQLKEQCQKLGLLMNEEQYLTGAYPPELSEPAVRYLEKEKREVGRRLREEAFNQWQGLTYSW